MDPTRLHRRRRESWPVRGMALLVSVDPAARTDRTDADLAAAVRLALDGGTPGGVELLDRLSTTTPRRRRYGPKTLVHDWAEPWGATPLAV
ncbi:hypothetical protein ACGFY7_39580 [Streptomyces prunicolor]|uniref:hypothetical protein n=1 Tax=Streptomyces prunicolor TaxID=67348 RepID=UPI003711EC00